MKFRRSFAFAVTTTVIGIITAAYGCFNYYINFNMNQHIFSILEKYGIEYPMPEAEVNEINRLLSWTIPNTISNVTISYWGPVPNSTDTRMQRVAYSYDTGRMSVSTYSEHRADLSQWNLELSACRPARHILAWFLIAAFILFLLAGILWFYYLKCRKK